MFFFSCKQLFFLSQLLYKTLFYMCIWSAAIVEGRTALNAMTSDPRRIWPEGKVHYQFSPTISKCRAKMSVKEVHAHIHIQSFIATSIDTYMRKQLHTCILTQTHT